MFEAELSKHNKLSKRGDECILIQFGFECQVADPSIQQIRSGGAGVKLYLISLNVVAQLTALISSSKTTELSLRIPLQVIEMNIVFQASGLRIFFNSSPGLATFG